MIYLDSQYITTKLFAEPLHQTAIAATEVDHSGSTADVLHNQLVRQTDRRIGNLVTSRIWHLGTSQGVGTSDEKTEFSEGRKQTGHCGLRIEIGVTASADGGDS
jgi:Zn-dependent M28 family amino/carboxypeptidase